MTSMRHVALIGGPESGKTTYVARLWLQLEEDLPDASLRRRGILDSFEDVNALMEPLLGGTYPQRTKAERHALRVPLTFVGERGEEPVELFVPDYNGEEVEWLFKYRGERWTEEWERQAGATGIMIFVRPTLLKDLPELTRGHVPVGGSDDTEPQDLFDTPRVEAEDPPQRYPDPESAVHVPTSVNLVEVLQFVREAKGLNIGERPKPGTLRVAVVISCWDVIADKAKTGPYGYVQQRLALLDDVLWSNFHPEDIRMFGLSSTGGDLRDKKFAEQYEPERSGYVVVQDRPDAHPRQVDDVALPVAWLIGGDHVPGLVA